MPGTSAMGRGYYECRGRNRKIINRMMDDGMTGGARKVYQVSPCTQGSHNGSRTAVLHTAHRMEGTQGASERERVGRRDASIGWIMDTQYL